MNIAHVTDSMEVGGAEVLIGQLCRSQYQHGSRVSVHCLFRKGPIGEKLEQEGVPVLVHGPGNRLHLMRSLGRKFREFEVDVVHCHNATPAIVAAIPGRFAGARVIFTRHGLVPPPYGLSREVQFSLNSLWAHAVVAVCGAANTNLQGAPLARKSRLVTIPNGIVEPDPIAGKESVPPKSGFTLVHVGRLNPLKDHATLLRAVAIARVQVPELRLWVVGGGQLRDSLVRLARDLEIQDAVVFCGEQPEVGAFLSAADVFVLSSISEGLPVSLLEAFALDRPAIVTDVGGMPEVVRRSGGGLVVPASNPEALAGAIEEMARDREALDRMGRAARSYFERHHAFSGMEQAYNRLYEGEWPLQTRSG